MSEVINLRRFRKQKSREESEKQAAANRLSHGRTKVEREFVQSETSHAARILDDHKIERVSTSALNADANKPGVENDN